MTATETQKYIRKKKRILKDFGITLSEKDVQKIESLPTEYMRDAYVSDLISDYLDKCPKRLLRVPKKHSNAL